MRVARDRVIFLALCVLDEARDECRTGPARPSIALRLALAYLFAVSDGDRAPFDLFWREATNTNQNEDYLRTVARGTGTTAAMNAICRTVGTELDVPLAEEIVLARRR